MSFDPDRCERFIEVLSVVGEGFPSMLGDTLVLAAVTQLGITGADFVELDERPGQFDSKYDRHGWFPALRACRNQDNDLFERLAANNLRETA